jgi:CheY-like chemotaxis protein
MNGKETILLVEDEPTLRDLWRHVLESQGYTVLAAPNGTEALVACARYEAKIHLLLTDVVMPQMNGRQLAERAAPIRPEMLVLFMSGYSEKAAVHHGMLDAGVAYLQKPIPPSVLLRRVRSELDRLTVPPPRATNRA